MPELSHLLDGVAGAQIVVGDARLKIREVCDDSRRVGPGDLFVAVPGSKVDGSRFVDDAVAKGATVVVGEAPELQTQLAGKAAFVLVPSARHALGVIAANRFQAAPALCLSAVTGTNGKTTTTYLVESVLLAAGRKPGVIGTVGYRFGGRQKEASLTTPGALELHGLLAEMKQSGASDVVMEASSIALEQGRLAGCRYRVAALTNVTQDHLDYHGTMERYFAAKAILFRELLPSQTGTSVLFADDQHGLAMRKEVRGPVLTLSRGERGADVVVLEQTLGADGIRLRLGTPAGDLDIVSPLVGDFNVANILTAVGIGLGHGLPPSAIAAGCARLHGVPGRLETVPNEAGVLCVVDYAHTPDALERALDVLRPLTKGRLICLFGCGGDRDRGKRPLMGHAAASRADLAIVTSDNPRTEQPESIIDMILEGVRQAGKPERTLAELIEGQAGYHVEVDRAKAISQAVALARLGDTVLLAGKGHEDYQIIGTQKAHFDDREIASAAFAARRRA
jgi:UDP-N-acetylmuramoyl-L-alanyl-D-glutamate--2,6-diaminopimelate ligase